MYNVSIIENLIVVNPAHSHLFHSFFSQLCSFLKTCSAGSKTFQKLTSVNLAEKKATDLKYYFYDINNPKEYLEGNDAVVVEQGPYKLKCVLETFSLSLQTFDD